MYGGRFQSEPFGCHSGRLSTAEDRSFYVHQKRTRCSPNRYADSGASSVDSWLIHFKRAVALECGFLVPKNPTSRCLLSFSLL